MGIIVDEDLEKYSKYIKDNLNKKRYLHSVGVSYTAAALAMRYNANIRSARIAGILHDCAKCYKPEKLLELCDLASIEISPTEKKNPELLHSKYGAYIAQNKLLITDSDIISAIYYHTVGRPNMTILEQIVFVSDFIEPSRSSFDGLDKIRKMCFEDINKATKMICEATLEYLDNKSAKLDKQTYATYEFYKNKIGEK